MHGNIDQYQQSIFNNRAPANSLEFLHQDKQGPDASKDADYSPSEGSVDSCN